MTRSTADNPDVYHKSNGNPVTYDYREDGYYVVVDNITGQVVQISDTTNPLWKDQMTNQLVKPMESR
jgi:hypothetical protein